MNRQPSEWKEMLDDPVIPKCILDRVFDRYIKISMKGESYRGQLPGAKAG